MQDMLERLLPARIDNNYRGHALAPWLMGVLVLMKLAMGINATFNTRYVATEIDKIAVASFSPAGEQAALGLFALVGLGNLLLGLIGLMVLWRYRAALPLFCVLVLIEQLAKHTLGAFVPIGADKGAAVPLIGIVFAVIVLSSLVLSLWGRNKPHS
jgi:hypothetical protein